MRDILLWLMPERMAIPAEWVAAAFGALAIVVACLWRDNLKLRTALLREKEEKVALCRELLKMAQSRSGSGMTRRTDS